MKISYITIFAISGIVITITMYFAGSYDFAPSTTENPFDIKATVTYEHNMKTVSCIRSPCGPLDAYGLSYTSEKPIQLISYNICGGIYCIKQENFASYGRGGITYHPFWGGDMTIGEIPWKVGDTVDIRLKVQPVTIAENGDVIPDKESIMFIDLGKSKITETGN